MKQNIRFYATEKDKELINAWIEEIFGKMIEMPVINTANFRNELQLVHLVEEKRKEDVVYKETKHPQVELVYGILDLEKSPILSYEAPYDDWGGKSLCRANFRVALMTWNLWKK